ncbi:hypothetical protein K503DRAFT_781147 [Rhizopogon vinicolor AM-OR11-026]|uniref:Uncharacterized protein n=1 Tax=Rhizopogon vinicolor AM-OR11-026 TaxID=1314800 RepID=A0A1B7N7H1_9AGAM|nr:hypothetical protein K503DRAFT_781147 [Rhizopogon vinicolor AM-OR11-026]
MQINAEITECLSENVLNQGTVRVILTGGTDLNRGTRYSATDDELLGVIVAPHDKEVSLEALGNAISDNDSTKRASQVHTYRFEEMLSGNKGCASMLGRYWMTWRACLSAGMSRLGAGRCWQGANIGLKGLKGSNVPVLVYGRQCMRRKRCTRGAQEVLKKCSKCMRGAQEVQEVYKRCMRGARGVRESARNMLCENLNKMRT